MSQPGDRGPRRPGKPGGRRPPGKGGPRRPDTRPGPIGLARVPGTEDAFELVHPPCVEETEPDFEEGIELRREGDPEGARDALRFALEACHDNLWVHVALGEIALEDFQDPTLARGHYGYAVELVRKALPPGFRGRLPRDRPANRPYLDALDGLARCFRALGRAEDADRTAALVRRLGGGAGKA